MRLSCLLCFTIAERPQLHECKGNHKKRFTQMFVKKSKNFAKNAKNC